MKLFLNLLIFFNFAYCIEGTFEIENTNIFTKLDESNFEDYNRIRIDSTFEDKNFENLIGKIIIDNNNRYLKQAKDNRNKTLIYRAYLKYFDEKNLLILGKQRVSYGVGRIWNPIDIYNPIDSTSIETRNREAVEALRYEYSISDVSNFDTTLSKNKFAMRIKGYVDIADISFMFLKNNESNENIYAYEMEGQLLDTGIEVRSEGAYFHTSDNKDYKEAILGAEYGFENSLNFLLEYKYKSLDYDDYLALNTSYRFTTLLSGNILGIKNLNDKSYVLINRFDYSLGDDLELSLGKYIYKGKKESEYGEKGNSYFVRMYVHF